MGKESSSKEPARQPEETRMVSVPMGATSPSLQIFDDRELQKRVRRDGRFLFTSAAAIAGGVALAFAGCYWLFAQNPDQFAKVPHVYLELKALDQSGHPVAGAEIVVNAQKVGSTDSFGEWRKFVRLKLGSSLALQFHKQTEAGKLGASKNLVVPLRRPSGGDIEIKESIQLLGMTAAAARDVTVQTEAVPTVAQESDVGFELNRIAVRVDMLPMDVARNPLGFQRQQFLKTKVEPAVKRSLVRKGLAIDDESPWQVVLRHTSAGDGESLVYVQSVLKNQKGESSSSFLRNYAIDPDQMAEQVVGLLRLHTQRDYQILHEDEKWYAMQPNVAQGFWRLGSEDVLIDSQGEAYRVENAAPIAGMQRMIILGSKDPCGASTNDAGQCTLQSGSVVHRAPRPDWQKHRLLMASPLDPSHKVFALGYEARRLSPQSFEYWAKPQAMANITVIGHGRVQLRAKVLADPTRAAQLPKQVQTIARR